MQQKAKESKLGFVQRPLRFASFSSYKTFRVSNSMSDKISSAEFIFSFFIAKKIASRM
jgi:hypothetical protein